MGDYSSYVPTGSGNSESRGKGFRERERDSRAGDPRDRDPRRDSYRDGARNANGRGKFDRDHRTFRDRQNTFRDGRYDDSYRPRQRNERNGARIQGGRHHEEDGDPDANLTKEQKIEKYERKLSSLMIYPIIEKYPLIGSQWGVKPKGLENVTAQRAKLSGLFPLPGAPRTAEDAKIGDLIKDKSSESGVLTATSKIDPLDSRNSCIVLVKGLDFHTVDHLKVADVFDQFLRSVDLEGTSLNMNYEKARKTKDESTLIIEFKTSTAATLALALNGKAIPAKSVAHEDADALERVIRDKFNCTFPIMRKCTVNGDDTNPVYIYLKLQKRGHLGFEGIRWNFEKFLIDKNGNVRHRYVSGVSPLQLQPVIESLLGEA